MPKFYSASTSIVNSRKAIRICLEIALDGEPNLDCDQLIIHSAMGHNFKELLSEGVIGAEGPNQTMLYLDFDARSLIN
jgi:hypothetical protein